MTNPIDIPGWLASLQTEEQLKLCSNNLNAQVITPTTTLHTSVSELKQKMAMEGMYAGDDPMIHSPKTGKTMEIIPLTNTTYDEELIGGRRYIS